MRRPILCPLCTSKLRRPIHHARRRLCSQVRGERRRDGTKKRREYQRTQAAKLRRKAKAR